MLVKEMLLKKIRLLNFIIFLLPICLLKQALGNETKKEEIIHYLENLKHFSSSFIQQNDLSIEEGELFIGEKRVRVEYSNPSKILIILSVKIYFQIQSLDRHISLMSNLLNLEF